jgi:hypothetical protein
MTTEGVRRYIELAERLPDGLWREEDWLNILGIVAHHDAALGNENAKRGLAFWPTEGPKALAVFLSVSRKRPALCGTA